MLRMWWSRIAGMFRRQTDAADFSVELRTHLDLLVAEGLQQGMTRDEAVRRAHITLGGMTQLHETQREQAALPFLETLAQDLRYAARLLRKSPGFTAVAVLSLALGIGANTAIFTLINAVMLDPLPIAEPERLVHISRVIDGGSGLTVSYPMYERLRDRLQSVSEVFARAPFRPFVSLNGTDEAVNAEYVSGNYFRGLAVQPRLGRLLEPADDQAMGASPVVVISYRLWQRGFGGDPQVIGKTLMVRGTQFTIIGVTPPEFAGVQRGRTADLAFPMAMAETLKIYPSAEWRTEADLSNLDLMGRLKPAATLAQADAEARVLLKPFLEEHSAGRPPKDRERILSQDAAVRSAGTGINRLRSTYQEPLFLLFGLVALVMLLACANLASMLLARAAARQQEISVRRALGARGGRLIRQFLTESLLLAVLGGAAGLALAQWFSRFLVTLMANGGALDLHLRPDWRVLAFTSVVALFASLACGLAPGIHAAGAKINPALKEVRSGRITPLARTLVIAQLALSVVLLVGANLFIGTLLQLYGLDSGFRREGVLTFTMRLRGDYPEARATLLAQELIRRLRTLPGVTTASALGVMPVSGSLWARKVQVEGYVIRGNGDEGAAFNNVAPDSFATMGTRQLQGRDFNERDTSQSPPVAIVNESFVRQFFPGTSPLGRHVTNSGVTMEVVGVVQDAKYRDLRRPMIPTVYIPWTQRKGDQPLSDYYVLRVDRGDPLRLTSDLQRMLTALDSGLLLNNVRTFSEVVDSTIVRERIMAVLAGFFGLLAVIIACLGIFGVMAFQVSRRFNELGVRMALGATRGDIIGLVLREVAVLLGIGCVLGCAAALSLTGLATQLLYGLTPTDPRVFVVAIFTLGVATLAAGYLPARRAANVDPMVALRHE